MKSSIETLNPTRVKLTVEVPFEELKPSLDAAYKKIAGQVNIPGFRKGRVPSAIIDQRVGRGVVLDEAVNEHLPKAYNAAVDEHKVKVLGQPEVDGVEFADGTPLTFTAEVDVRPEIDLPDYQGLEVTVADAEVTDSDVDEQLEGLRSRFGSLSPVERAVEHGDFVTLDLSAPANRPDIDDAAATGLSYEVGSGQLLDGLDEAIIGKSAGDVAPFQSPLRAGENSPTSDVDHGRSQRRTSARNFRRWTTTSPSSSEFDTLAESRTTCAGAARCAAAAAPAEREAARQGPRRAAVARRRPPADGDRKAEADLYRRQSAQQQPEAAGLTRCRALGLTQRAATSRKDETVGDDGATSVVNAQLLQPSTRLRATSPEAARVRRSATKSLSSGPNRAARAQRSGVRPEEFFRSTRASFRRRSGDFCRRSRISEARCAHKALMVAGPRLPQRLLRERIIFLGPQVDDAIANAICAQLLLLAAEDPTATSTSTSTRPVARSPPAWRSTTRCSSSSPTTSPPSPWAWPRRWASSCSAPGQGQALRPAARADHDAPAVRWHRWHRVRHRHPGRADALHQAHHAGADRLPHRPDHRADRADSDRDRWFTAEEAKEYGFVDHVVSGAEQIPATTGRRS